LCAGAIRSPVLLLRSGIGPAELLRRHAIAIHADLPVGRSGAEHPQVFLPFDGQRTAPAPSGPPLEWALDTPDVTLHAWLGPIRELSGAGGASHLADLGVLVRRPVGRSVVELAADALSARVVLAGLAEAEDRAKLRGGVRLGGELLRSAGFVPGVAGVDLPPAPDAPDEAVDRWIARNLTCAVHLSATTPVGHDDDPRAVLDAAFRVRGIEGLRVVDSGALPALPSRGPAATVLMAAERAASTWD
jgi:choline dehydrogenase